MKKLLTLSLLFVTGFVFAQQKPQQFVSGLNVQGVARDQFRIDSFLYLPLVDTTRIPGRGGVLVVKSSDGRLYLYDGVAYQRIEESSDTASLSFRINQKLNISDTTNKWIAVGRRLTDTLYRVNDSTIGFTINGLTHTFLIRGSNNVSSSATLQSVITANNQITASPQSIKGIGSNNLTWDSLNRFDVNFFNRMRIQAYSGQTTALFGSTTALFNAGDSVTVGLLTGRFSSQADVYFWKNLYLANVPGSADTTANKILVQNRSTGLVSWSPWLGGSSGGSGVTQVNSGLGLSGGPITTTGTLVLDTTYGGTLGGIHTRNYNDARYQSVGNYITALTGDVGATGPGSVAATIQPNAVTTTKINNNAVTLAKQATNTANTLQGFDGSGNAADVGIGSGISLSGSTLSATGVPESIIGQLYAKGTWANLNQFTASGTPNASISSGHILFGSGNSDFVRSINIDSLIGRNGFTNLKNVYYYAEIVTGTKTSTSKFGIGLRSQVAALLSDALVQFDATNSGSSGKISFVGLTGANDGIVTTSTSAVSFTAGDKIGLTFQMIDNTLILSAKNITTSGNPIFLATPYTFTFDIGSLPFPNSGKFAVFNCGGSGDAFTVDSLNVFSGTTKNPAVCFIGDSKTQLYPVDFNLAYPNLLRSNYGSTVTNAGSSESATDALSRLQEILQINPRTVVLSIGRNGNGFDTLTAYLPLYDSLVAHGIFVINFIEGYDASWTGAPQFIAFLRGHFPANTIVDGYTPIQNCAACIAADNVHLSILGHQVEANTLAQSNLIVRGTYVDGIAGSGISGQIPLWDGIKSITGDNSFLYNKATENMNITGSLNSGTGLTITNANAGTSASARITLANDAGNSALFGITSSTNPQYGGLVPNSAFLYMTNQHGEIMVDQASSDFGIYLGTAQTTSAFKLTSAGLASFPQGYSGTGIKVLGVTSTGVLVRTSIDTGSAGGSGITTLNTLTAGTQTFAVGTSGSDFNISSATATHTFNIPDAGASARGLVTTSTQTFAGAKTFTDNMAITKTVNGTLSLTINNPSGGASGAAAIILENDQSNFLYAYNIGSGETAYGNLLPNSGAIYATHPSFHILNDRTGGFIDFAAGSAATAQLTITDPGIIKIGHKPDSAATATGGYLFRDAATGNIMIGPGGSGGGVPPDTLHVLSVGDPTGVIIGFTNGGDSMFLERMKGPNSIAISKGSDSTNIFKLVNDTAIGTAANYYYGTSSGGSAGRLGYYSLPTVVLGTVLTGYTSGAGTVSATDNILQAIQKLNGNAALLAPIASPTFTGTPAAPTASPGTNTTQLATTAFVTAALPSSATYTPTLTNTANISGASLNQATYIKVGNLVHVTIGGTFTPTVISTASTLTFSLPFTTSTTTQTTVGSGSIAYNSGTLGYYGGIANIVSASTGTFVFTPTVTTGSTANFSFSFDYTTN